MRSTWRRRRKTVLVASAAVVLGGVVVVQVVRGRVERYRSGEATEGLVDRLARETPDDLPPVRFHDAAGESGLDFTHFPGTRSGRLPEDMGSGVALGDFDGDGWTDVFLVNAAPSDGARSRLFRNLGGGRFSDVTETSGIDHRGFGMAAAFADVDSDGDLDLFVSGYGTCRLYENEGDGRFRDASERAGLDAYDGFWTGIAVGDHDLDGNADIYVCGYVDYDEERHAGREGTSQYGTVIPALINPSTFEPERNLLFAGNGDGTFREIAEACGVDNPEGRSLGALFCDVDGDGRQDLYVANDVSDNALFLNRGEGTFVDRTTEALVGDYRGAMGMAAADFDGDLDLDLFITHWVAQENALYEQHSGGGGDAERWPIFMDVADRYGVGATALQMVGWATRFFDFDNDGRLDLFVVNGSTIPDSEQPEKLVPQRSQLFWRSPSRRGYFEVGAACGDFFAEPAVGRGGATFDYDLDGDEDIVVVRHGGRVALLRNDGGNGRPTLRVRLREPSGNRFAVGAMVRAQIGDRPALEVVGTQGSYLSQHAVGEVSFGLGDAGVVERLDVTWPDGTEESAGPFLAHTLVTWTRGEPPRTQSLPGRRDLDTAGPPDADGQRAFYALRGDARDARLAGDLSGASALYAEALALWPGHGDCLYYLGNMLLGLGDDAFALAVFERLVDFEPESSPGWMQIGLIGLPGGEPALDDLDAAKAAFRRCHELNGEESRPVLQLGIVALLSGELDDAASLLADARRLNPRSVEARWFEGRLAYLAGDADLAREHLEAARELARMTGAGESQSNEGDTATGAAMVASGGAVLDPALTRWSTVGEREGDVEDEYGPPR